MRRNLSGIFIFDTLEGDESRQPTCFEDCREETQDRFLNGLEIEGLKNLSKTLADTIRDIGEQFDIMKD